MSKRAGERTLFMSVLLSSPGPLVVGLGLFVGRSTTQLADFIRRSSELAAIIVSYVIFRLTHRDDAVDLARKARLERIANSSVAVAMILGGTAMLVVAGFAEKSESGNVIPGLVIALLGVVANTLFWLRYRRLNRLEANAILAVQSRLYRVKALVDLCVSAALLAVVLAPATLLAYYMDIAGSVVVAVYMIVNGVQTFLGRQANEANQEDSTRGSEQI